jgi:pimeloyl-ACP methyl ester carboxylesterase
MIQKEHNGIAFAAGSWPLRPQRPTIVFIHGSGGNHSLWHGQVDAFAGTANTLALDLPGHGASRGPGCERVADYARKVAGLLVGLPVPRPVPCGLSLGGAIALRLLIDRPVPLAGAVLMATGARLRVLPEIIRTIEARYAAFVDTLGGYGASPRTDPACLAPVLRALAACPPAVTAGDFRACDRFDVMDRLDRIQVPVLIVSGEDDQLTPPKYGDYLEQHIAGSRRVRIAEAGHLVPVEKTDAVNRALEDFVAGL